MKGQFNLLRVIDSPKLGVVELILKKMTEMVVRSDFEVPFKLKWVYRPDFKSAYVIKIGL